MTLAESIWMAASFALPGLGFIIAMTIGRGSLIAGIVGSAVSGAATGAYAGSVAAQQVAAADPGAIATRAGILGFGLGVAVGIVLAAALFAWRASRPTAESQMETGPLNPPV